MSRVLAVSNETQIRGLSLTVSDQDAAWDEGWGEGCSVLHMAGAIKI